MKNSIKDDLEIEKFKIKNLKRWTNVHVDQLNSIFADLTACYDQQIGSTLWLIDGEMGSGKTTFIREWLLSFGINEVQSPTYAFHHHYQNDQNIIFDHFDLYRISNVDDLESIGFWDLIQNNGAVKVVEWVQNIQDYNWIKFNRYKKVFCLQIDSSDDHKRNYSLFEVQF